MTIFQIGLALSVAGPRKNLLNEAIWPMALRLTVGTDVAPDDAKQCILDTLPWNIWTTPKVDVAVTTDGQTFRTSACDMYPVPADAPDFVDALKQSIEDNGTRLALANKLDFRYIAQGGTPVSDDAPKQVTRDADPRTPVSWPGLMMTVSSLAAPTPSALLCTWYFKLDRTLIADAQADGTWRLKDNAYLSAAPGEFHGAARNGVSVQPPDGQGDLPHYPVHVHTYEKGGALAYCEALKLQSVLDSELDEMDSFWLSIRDSRDDSLLQLGPQLQQALKPSAMLGALSIDDCLDATRFCDPQHPDDEQSWRMLTRAQMSEALSAWRATLSEQDNKDDVQTAWRKSILKAASDATEDQADAAREAYGDIVKAQFDTLDRKVIRDETVRLDIASLARLVTARMLSLDSTGVAKASCADGIDLLVGDESLRLRHIDDPQHGAVDDVAQIQIFGRRSSDRAMLERNAGAGGAPWYALTAARYTLPGANDTLLKSTPRILGVTTTYLDDVLYREVSYFGCNMVCINPLAAVHRQRLDDDALEHFSLATIRREVPDTMPSIPLRYGDFYEFAASVMDRAGGMAAELTASDQPWLLDLTRTKSLQPPRYDHVRYQRPIAVGDVGVLPQIGTRWPQTPKGVALRCMEQASGPVAGPAPAYLFLAPASDDFVASADGIHPPDSYSFTVHAPKIDEQTYLRWSMPPTTLADDVRAQAAKALQAEMARIYQLRDALLCEPPPVDKPDYSISQPLKPMALVDDPAVAGIGVRWIDSSGHEDCISAPVPSTSAIEVKAGTSFNVNKTTRVFEIGEGDFVRLRLCVLVSRDDLERFDPSVLGTHLEDPHPWSATHEAFKESIVWVEVASAVIPEPDAALLTLEEQATGDIAVNYALNTLDAAKQRDHLNVSATVIASERWIWRNLPLPPEPGFSDSAQETLRRVASGPPADLMDAALRDTSRAVGVFDAISGIDSGFVLRADQTSPYPKQAQDKVLLLTDTRDRHTQADYLRYSIRFRSRYAPVLKRPQSDWSGQRRIAVAFRGDLTKIKPPKLLAVLPLTQALHESPVPRPDDTATPFLVVFDEAWFREYGVGERLGAYVAHVKPEIPEVEPPPDARRFGPLPDHHLHVSNVAHDQPLACFGPFGMTLDRDGSQARANATAFVVYPPPGTPAHYSVFVEFARVLDLPTQDTAGKPVKSECVEAVPLYTIAHSSRLTPTNSPDPLKLTAVQSGFTFKSDNNFLPFEDAAGTVLDQYRYVLIVGHTVRDGGRGVDVFLPEDALWLWRVDADTAKATWISDAPKTRFTAALVVEILLNGRFADRDVHPLADAKSLRELWRKLLPGAEQPDSAKDMPPSDAPAMVRRVSPWFMINMPSA